MHISVFLHKKKTPLCDWSLELMFKKSCSQNSLKKKQRGIFGLFCQIRTCWYSLSSFTATLDLVKKDLKLFPTGTFSKHWQVTKFAFCARGCSTTPEEPEVKRLSNRN